MEIDVAYGNPSESGLSFTTSSPVYNKQRSTSLNPVSYSFSHTHWLGYSF